MSWIYCSVPITFMLFYFLTLTVCTFTYETRSNGDLNLEDCPRSSRSIVNIFGIEADLCKDRQSCHRDQDCTRDNQLTLCNCSSICGPICMKPLQLTPVPEIREGTCPVVMTGTFYVFFQCYNHCELDMHCTDPRMKCCYSSCGKKCTLPVEFDTEVPTTITSVQITQNTTSFEGLTDIIIGASSEVTEYDKAYSCKDVNCSSTQKCVIDIYTGIAECRDRRPSSDKCRCRPLCGTDGITYRNERRLRDAERRTGRQILIVRIGPCRRRDRQDNFGPGLFQEG
ncbi:uncharacterized protein [Amphiura filiformis]|uniref:uncharacterized protein n=1 Tax=Amphiura filiformis TaxID=82378 RepID=UPI003B21E772